MRLAVFSDIHGNLIAFEAMLRDLESVGAVDFTWILGDLAANGARPAECIRRVKAIWEAGQPPKPPEGADASAFPRTPPKVRVIRGNTDRYLIDGSREAEKPAENAEAYAKMVDTVRTHSSILVWGMEQLSFEDYDFLRKLGTECELRVDGYGTVIGYHAVPGNDETVLLPDTPDEEAADALLDREGRLGIGAHIHEQMDRTLKIGGWRILNAGSVGLSEDKPGYAQWALLTFENGNVQVDLRAVPYDVDAYIRELETCGIPYPESIIKRLRPQPEQS